MKTPFNIVPVADFSDILEIPETEYMCSKFNTSPNITKEDLLHLLSGKPLVDLSDEEFIHCLQLNDEAQKFASDLLNA